MNSTESFDGKETDIKDKIGQKPNFDIESDPEEDTEVEEEETKMTITDDLPPIAAAAAVNSGNDSGEYVDNGCPSPIYTPASDYDSDSPIPTPTPTTVSDYVVMPIKQKSPSPVDDEREDKGKKKGGGGGRGSGKSRKWCFEDEITVLEGLIAYKTIKGVLPPSDMAELLRFIKSKLVRDMTRSQLYEKVRRLKGKFLSYMANTPNYVKPVFFHSHDSTLFDLSEKIWSDIDTNTNTKTNTNPRKKRKRGADDDQTKQPKKTKKLLEKQQPLTEEPTIIREVKQEEVTIMEEKDDDDDQTKQTKKSEKLMEKQPLAEEPTIIKEVKQKEVTIMEEEDDDLNGDFQSKYPFLFEAICEESSGFLLVDSLKKLLKENMNTITSADAKELNQKWQKIREEEREILVEKMKLVTMHTEFILKGSNKSV